MVLKRFVLALSFFASILLVSPDLFDDAERRANDFFSEASSLRRLDKDDVVRLVQAICDADEEERQSIAQDVSSRVKDEVNSKYNDLEHHKAEALETFDKVLGDENFKDKYDKAKEYKEKINNTWESIDRMTKPVRGANHPVVSYMLRAGQDAHNQYETNSSNCHAYEWTIGSGRADCLYAPSGDECQVIELKPDNSRGISRGRDQARGYADALNNSPEELQKLKNEKSAFQSCKKFVPIVMVYKLCPEIDDNGEFRSVSVNWRKD